MIGGVQSVHTSGWHRLRDEGLRVEWVETDERVEAAQSDATRVVFVRFNVS